MKSTLAIAQIKNNDRNPILNLDNHIRFIKEATKIGANFVLFPELSLTGYIRKEVIDFHYYENDDRLKTLRDICYEKNVTISVGVPIKHQDKFLITTLTINPNRTESLYSKQYLHPGEELFYSTNKDFNPITKVNQNLISNAICFDIENKEHQESESVTKSNIYAASIFYSKNGIDGGLKTLSSIAIKKNKLVLMSNYCGKCWDTEAGGRSSIWKPDGSVLVQADSEKEELLIAENIEKVWRGYKIGM